MFDQGITSSASFNNGDYFVGVLNSITGKAEGITIVAKDLTNPTVEMTESQAYALRNVFMFIVPAIVNLHSELLFISEGKISNE